MATGVHRLASYSSLGARPVFSSIRPNVMVFQLPPQAAQRPQQQPPGAWADLGTQRPEDSPCCWTSATGPQLKLQGEVVTALEDGAAVPSHQPHVEHGQSQQQFAVNENDTPEFRDVLPKQKGSFITSVIDHL